MSNQNDFHDTASLGQANYGWVNTA
uniref:Uncharacterized protein n=1 Tax=mine drainage metagenome TaxID=410659 RepID=E6PZ98_9ZZZZ